MSENLTSKVKTVILLMFENRSFDHMLGHLSLEINPKVNGLTEPRKQDQYKNIYEGEPYYPYPIPNNLPLTFDIPHEYNYVDTQLGWDGGTQQFLMDGFVKAYAEASNSIPVKEAEPMGYFSYDQVPITSFLAKNFCTCDNWFCPIPTSTQPNRTMAFTGQSAIHLTKGQLIPAENNIFDWLDKSNVKWKVYHDCLSFFILYPDLLHHVFSDNFCNYREFHNEWHNERKDTDPQLIIIEPTYHDAPHINKHPNDNHAPLAIGWGEDFLRGVYESVVSNREKYGETVMIVYYDEHGGFYDHVPPPQVPYTTTGKDAYQFKTLGPRIPGIVVSPFVTQGSVCDKQFDHTSVLQFLAEIFTPGKPYSSSVEARRSFGIKSISEALTNDKIIEPPVAPSVSIHVTSILGESIANPPEPSMSMRQAFESAALNLIRDHPEDVKKKYPELFRWKNAIEKRRK